MLFKKFRKSNESEFVIEYLHALIKGEEAVKPAVSDPKSEELMIQFEEYLNVESSHGQLLIDLIKNESSLCGFGASMSFLASDMGEKILVG